jgi:hypothetical protein
MVRRNALGEPRRLVGRSHQGRGGGDTLDFVVEVWDERAVEVEAVVARVGSEFLARTAYETARTEFAGRRVTIRHANSVIADSRD